jgi:hypothetical protein
MNEARVSYVKWFPLLFIGGLLVTALRIYFVYSNLFLYDYERTLPPLTQQAFEELLASLINNVFLWTTAGLAFRQWKAAMMALGIALLLSVAGYFLYEFDVSEEVPLMITGYFLPALVFGLGCFKKAGLRYFLPIWFLAYAFSMIYAGSANLDLSPYTNWYRLLRLDMFFKVPSNRGEYYIMNLPYYTHHLAVICTKYIIIGECFNAAMNKKRGKYLFTVDFGNRYPKAGAVSLFVALRLILNLLTIGLFIFPLAHFFDEGRVHFKHQSLLRFCLGMVAGLACLVAVTLYYRRFLVEYFISIRKKIYWLFWIVNIPVVGLLVFPFVAMFSRTSETETERTLFFFNDAMDYRKPYKILTAVLLLSLLNLYFSEILRMGSGLSIFLWLAELALLIWYTASMTGYYAILVAGAVSVLSFMYPIIVEKRGYHPGIYNFGYSGAPFYQWLISGFLVVQYTVLLPIFHLRAIKTLQEQNGIRRIEER